MIYSFLSPNKKKGGYYYDIDNLAIGVTSETHKLSGECSIPRNRSQARTKNLMEWGMSLIIYIFKGKEQENVNRNKTQRNRQGFACVGL